VKRAWSGASAWRPWLWLCGSGARGVAAAARRRIWLIFAGWLPLDRCASRAGCLRSSSPRGRGAPSAVAGPGVRRGGGPSTARPGCRCGSGVGDLPAEVRQFAGDGDRGDGRALAALLVQLAPALVQAPLGAPGAVDGRGGGGVLAAAQAAVQPWRLAIVPG